MNGWSDVRFYNRCFYTNPCFADLPNGDLHILGNSPCIDQGYPEIAPPEDIEGNSRFDHLGIADALEPYEPGGGNGFVPTYPDVGAYEFGIWLKSFVKPRDKVLAVGIGTTIEWAASGVPNVDILLSTDNGISWQVLASNIDAGAGTFDFTPGAADVSDECVVRIVASSDVDIYAEATGISIE